MDLKEKFVKLKQYKNFGFIVGGISIVFVLMIVFRENRNENAINSGRFYKKEIKTGVDGLSDKELWLERSTNEIEDIRNSGKKLEHQNTLLQKELESLKKLVIGVGVHLRAFDDQQDPSRTNDNGPSRTGDNGFATARQPYAGKISTNETAKESSTNLSFEKLENFIEQKGIRGSGSGVNDASTSQNDRVQNHTGGNNKVLKNGIKVVKFNYINSEYDLDENFIFAGTYARTVLVGTVVASASIGASANPEPVLLRINDFGNSPNNIKSFLKDAMIIGAAYGDLSSESVVIRLERIVKIDKRTGVGIDIPVKGYVAAENGSSKIRGTVIDRAGVVARNAAVAGFMSGMANYLSANNQQQGITFEPNSGLAQFSPQAGTKMLQQGASKGIGNAVEKYADFIIKRAEQMQPVIVIDGGRKLTIVFTESVKASAVHMKFVRRKLVRSEPNRR